MADPGGQTGNPMDMSMEKTPLISLSMPNSKKCRSDSSIHIPLEMH